MHVPGNVSINLWYQFLAMISRDAKKHIKIVKKAVIHLKKAATRAIFKLDQHGQQA